MLQEMDEFSSGINTDKFPYTPAAVIHSDLTPATHVTPVALETPVTLGEITPPDATVTSNAITVRPHHDATSEAAASCNHSPDSYFVNADLVIADMLNHACY